MLDDRTVGRPELARAVDVHGDRRALAVGRERERVDAVDRHPVEAERAAHHELRARLAPRDAGVLEPARVRLVEPLPERAARPRVDLQVRRLPGERVVPPGPDVLGEGPERLVGGERDAGRGLEPEPAGLEALDVGDEERDQAAREDPDGEAAEQVGVDVSHGDILASERAPVAGGPTIGLLGRCRLAAGAWIRATGRARALRIHTTRTRRRREARRFPPRGGGSA